MGGGGAAALPAELFVHLVEGEHGHRGRRGERGGVCAPAVADLTTGNSTLQIVKSVKSGKYKKKLKVRKKNISVEKKVAGRVKCIGKGNIITVIQF